MSVLTDGLNDDNPGAIAAPLAVADSTSQNPTDSQQPDSLYPSSPSPNSPTSLPGRPRVNTTPRVGFVDGLSSELESPLPSPDRATRHPASLTPGSLANRTATQHLTSIPFFPPKFSIEGVPARLSPAIITRQPQHPILSLPPIASMPSTSNISRRRSQSLRSMPALPMEGTEDPDPAEDDNMSLGDLDEEDEGTGDEDEEAEAEAEAAVTEHPDTLSEDGESIPSPRSSVQLQTSRRGILPTVEVSPLDMSFLDSNNGPTHRHDDKTPENSQRNDYFSFSLSEPGPSRTPLHPSRQFSPVLHTPTPSSNILAAAWAPSPRVMPTPSTPTLNARPNMYHQGSRSMIDVSQVTKNEKRSPEATVKTPKTPVRISTAEPDTASPDAVPDGDPETLFGPPLRRRLSMPTFVPSSAPPPYPMFRFGEHGPAIQPRDEEGCERLPRYTNDIYLRAIMPRKMEFSAPGVQSRDRKWRRTLCVLEGTAFRVYNCPPAAVGKGLIGNLWEKTVGVGDIATPPVQASAATTKAKKEERDRERCAGEAKLARAEGVSPQSPSSPTAPSASTSSPVTNRQVSQPSPSPSTSRSRLLPSNFRKRKRIASDVQSTPRSESFARRSFSNLRTVSSHSGFRPSPVAASGVSLHSSASCPDPCSNPCSTTTEPATPIIGSSRTPRQSRARRRHLYVDDPDVPQPQPQDLLHAYALHNSESGLGTDYVKRQNVIRIRMEGQQFLLQARDVASVVDWIEVRLSYSILAAHEQ